MHLVTQFKGENARTMARLPAPGGPGLTPAESEKVERIEVWGSSFTDPGPDYCEFRMMDVAGKVLSTHRMEGF